MASPRQKMIPIPPRKPSQSTFNKTSQSASPNKTSQSAYASPNKTNLSASPRKASVADLRNHVAEIIQCAICIEAPTDPRCLPCLHTYCLHCLESFYQRSVDNLLFGCDKIQCPECCKMSEVPPGGLINLPNDFRVKQLEEIFKHAVDIQDDLGTSPSRADLAGSSPSEHIDPSSTPPANNPLFTETTPSRTETLHYLIERCPREARDFADSLPVQDQRKVVSRLIHGRSALCVACEQEAYDLMVHFIERCRADVNQVIIGTARGGKEIESTILIQAAAAKDMTAAQVLVSHGAAVNQADGEGITALFVACLEGSLDMVEYLIDVGAKVTHNVNKYGASPIMAVSSVGHLNILKCLVDKGADVNDKQKDGYTPLMAACHKSKDPDQTAAFLLTQWAEINVQSDKGSTALMYAVQRGSADTISILLMNGAHVNVKDNEGHTALHHAIIKSAVDLIQILMTHGADPHVKNKSGTSCLDLAVHNASMMKILKTYKRIKRKK